MNPPPIMGMVASTLSREHEKSMIDICVGEKMLGELQADLMMNRSK